MSGQRVYMWGREVKCCYDPHCHADLMKMGVNLARRSHEECRYCDNWFHHLCVGEDGQQQHWCMKCMKEEAVADRLKRIRGNRNQQEQPRFETADAPRQSSEMLATPDSDINSAREEIGDSQDDTVQVLQHLENTRAQPTAPEKNASLNEEESDEEGAPSAEDDGHEEEHDEDGDDEEANVDDEGDNDEGDPREDEDSVDSAAEEDEIASFRSGSSSRDLEFAKILSEMNLKPFYADDHHVDRLPAKKPIPNKDPLYLRGEVVLFNCTLRRVEKDSTSQYHMGGWPAIVFKDVWVEHKLFQVRCKAKGDTYTEFTGKTMLLPTQAVTIVAVSNHVLWHSNPPNLHLVFGMPNERYSRLPVVGLHWLAKHLEVTHEEKGGHGVFFKAGSTHRVSLKQDQGVSLLMDVHIMFMIDFFKVNSWKVVFIPTKTGQMPKGDSIDLKDLKCCALQLFAREYAASSGKNLQGGGTGTMGNTFEAPQWWFSAFRGIMNDQKHPLNSEARITSATLRGLMESGKHTDVEQKPAKKRAKRRAPYKRDDGKTKKTQKERWKGAAFNPDLVDDESFNSTDDELLSSAPKKRSRRSGAVTDSEAVPATRARKVQKRVEARVSKQKSVEEVVEEGVNAVERVLDAEAQLQQLRAFWEEKVNAAKREGEENVRKEGAKWAETQRTLKKRQDDLVAAHEREKEELKRELTELKIKVEVTENELRRTMELAEVEQKRREEAQERTKGELRREADEAKQKAAALELQLTAAKAGADKEMKTMATKRKKATKKVKSLKQRLKKTEHKLEMLQLFSSSKGGKPEDLMKSLLRNFRSKRSTSSSSDEESSDSSSSRASSRSDESSSSSPESASPELRSRKRKRSEPRRPFSTTRRDGRRDGRKKHSEKESRRRSRSNERLGHEEGDKRGRMPGASESRSSRRGESERDEARARGRHGHAASGGVDSASAEENVKRRESGDMMGRMEGRPPERRSSESVKDPRKTPVVRDVEWAGPPGPPQQGQWRSGSDAGPHEEEPHLDDRSAKGWHSGGDSGTQWSRPNTSYRN